MFSPLSKTELKSAIDACRRLSAVGDCSAGPHGRIAEWDVSHVTDMRYLLGLGDPISFNMDLSKWDVSSVTSMQFTFREAESFNQDLSKWDVSRVTDMLCTFYHAKAFNADLSKWDVSSVTITDGMFQGATSFSADVSKWDVSRVTDMRWMFDGARSFQHVLCGKAWVEAAANSKVLKNDMFHGTLAGISMTACGGTSSVNINVI